MRRPDVLTQIAASVEQRLHERKLARPYPELLGNLKGARTPKNFIEQLRNGINVISEIKFRSPSQKSPFGIVASRENAVKIADGYLTAGATALSVLTERDHFSGDPAYLRRFDQNFPRVCF